MWHPKENESFVCSIIFLFQGGTAPPTPKLECFWSISKLSTSFLIMICILVNRPRNSKIALIFRWAKRFLSYWSKQHFDLIHDLKTTWRTKLFDAIWVPWTIYCKMHINIIFQGDTFWNKAQNMLIWVGVGVHSITNRQIVWSKQPS